MPGRLGFQAHLKSSATFGIGELARRAGLATSAIRYYESIGLIPEAPRESGRRRYDADALERLGFIDLARRAGFTLAEVRTLCTGFSPDTPPSARWRTLAERKLPEIEAQIARAEAMKRVLEEGMECGCLSLEDCEMVPRA